MSAATHRGEGEKKKGEQCGRQTLAVEAVRASERSLDDFGLTLDSHPLDFSCLVVGPNDRCLTVTESSHVVRGDCLEKCAIFGAAPFSHERKWNTSRRVGFGSRPWRGEKERLGKDSAALRPTLSAGV